MELSLEHIRENVICAKQLELIMRRSKDVGDSTEKETKEILQAIKLAEKLHEVEKEIEEKEATANRNRNRALFLGVVFAVVMPVVAVTYSATAAGATALTAATGGQILAILGGGTLASGGFGMAGGAAVLAGMVGTGAIITVGGSAKAGYDLFWARMGNKNYRKQVIFKGTQRFDESATVLHLNSDNLLGIMTDLLTILPAKNYERSAATLLHLYQVIQFKSAIDPTN